MAEKCPKCGSYNKKVRTATIDSVAGSAVSGIGTLVGGLAGLVGGFLLSLVNTNHHCKNCGHTWL